MLAPGALRRRRARRGWNMLELAVAAGVFLLAAGLISLTVAQAMISQASVRTQRLVDRALATSMDDLARSVSYDQVIGASFTPDSRCSLPAGAVTDKRVRSCLSVGGKSYEVRYDVTVSNAAAEQGNWADLVATVKLPGNVEVSQVRRVAAPAGTVADGHAIIRVTLTGVSAEGLKVPVQVIRADGSVAGSGRPSAGNVAVIDTVASNCPAAAACTLALGDSSGRFGLSAPDGQRIVLASKMLVNVPGRVFEAAAATINVTATSDTPSVSGPNPQVGSVCLWASFTDMGVARIMPLCNTTVSGSVSLSTYAPDPGQPQLRRPVPVDTPVTVTVDHPNGSCPMVAGMVGQLTAGSWSPAAVCTSWTWGVPAQFGKQGALAAFKGSTVVTLAEASSDTYQAVWSGDQARPAAGYGTEPVWARPRQAGLCSADATCTSVATATSTPEASECPGRQCLSAVFAPDMTAPVSGPGKANTVQTPVNATTPFDVTVTDRDGRALTMTMTTLPMKITDNQPEGVLQTGGATVTSGQALASTTAAPSGASTVTVPLTYNNPSTTPKYMRITVADTNQPTRQVTLEVGLYANGSGQTWLVSGSDVTTTQGASGVAVTATLTDTQGNPSASVPVTLSGLPAGATTTSPATTDANGKVTFTVNVAGSTAAGTSTMVIKDANRSGNAAFTVNPVVGSLTVAATGAAQGGRGTVTVSAFDKAGAPMAAVPVQLSALTSTQIEATGVYPEYSTCVTGADGKCRVALAVTSTAPAGVYTVQAVSGSLTVTTTATVASAPKKITIADGISVAQGSSTPVTLAVADGNGAVMPSTTVSVTVLSATSKLSAPASVTTGPDGKATFTLTAAADAPASGRSPVLRLTAGAASSDVVATVTQTAKTIEPGPSVTVAAGKESSGWVTVRDAAGAPVAGVKVTFSGPANVRVSGVMTTGADGRAATAVIVSAGTSAGTYQVTATAPGAGTSTLTVTVTS